MATVIQNTPGQAPARSGSSGIIVALVILAMMVLFIFYGIPQITSSLGSNQGTSVNVPDKIDVNVQGK